MLHSLAGEIRESAVQRRLLIQFFAFAFIMLATVPAHAGRVANIEKLRAKIKDGFFGEAKASFSLKEGNTDKFQFAGGGLLGYLNGKHLIFLSGGGEWEEANKKLVTSEALGHIRYNYEFQEWLWGELLQQAAFDKFARLSLRYLSGAGLRARLFESKSARFSAYLGTGYLFEYERIATEDNPPFGPPVPSERTRHHRLGSYLSINYEITDVVVFGAVAYYQPRLDHPLDDFHLYSQNELDFIVIKDRLKFFVAYNLELDSEPPVFVKKVDHTLTNGVKVQF